MKDPANATRLMLEDLVTHEPGLNKTELCERAGLAWGTVYYHVRILERQGRIRCHPTGWETLHFPPTLDEREGTWLAALRAPARMDMLRHVEGRHSAVAAELASSMGLSRRMVQRHLTTLGRAGVLEREGRRSARYRVSAQVLPFVGRLLRGT